MKIESFIKENNAQINHLRNSHKNYIDDNSIVNYLSSKHDLDDLSGVDFKRKIIYEINDFLYKSKIKVDVHKTYVCQCCLFFNEKSFLFEKTNLYCFKCEDRFNSTTELSVKKMCEVFKNHPINGVSCNACNRYIPVYSDKKIICPYIDCFYSSDFYSFKKMRNPYVLLDNQNDSSHSENSSSDKKYSKIKSIIRDCLNSIIYHSSQFTMHHKISAYESFLSLIDKEGEKFVDYILCENKNDCFQQKLFQEYLVKLEQKLPLSFKKNKTLFNIKSIYDDNLNIFSGMTEFEAAIDSDNYIPNNTKEIYIGGRSSTYIQKYFIGKVLSIYDKDNKKSLMSNIKEVGFYKILMNDVKPSTNVIVKHMMIPPHYQMGGMVYINRAKKDIFDAARNDGYTSE